MSLYEDLPRFLILINFFGVSARSSPIFEDESLPENDSRYTNRLKRFVVFFYKSIQNDNDDKISESELANLQSVLKCSSVVSVNSEEDNTTNQSEMDIRHNNKARLLGLDARSIVPNADNYPDSKVNLCIDKVMEIYEQTTEQKGVQAIFCDIAVNSDDGRFSVYDYIKEELIRRGIPESEICTAGDAKDQKQRNEMYAQLRSGTKRIVLASASRTLYDFIKIPILRHIQMPNLISMSSL